MRARLGEDLKNPAVGRGGALVESVEAFRPEGRDFESHSSRHVGTFGKSLTHSCLWRFGVKFRHSIRAVSGALLSSSRLEEAIDVDAAFDLKLRNDGSFDKSLGWLIPQMT